MNNGFELFERHPLPWIIGKYGVEQFSSNAIFDKNGDRIFTSTFNNELEDMIYLVDYFNSL